MMSSSVCSLGILVPTPTLILSQSWTQIWAPTSFPWRTHFKKVCRVEARAGGFQRRWRRRRMNCICHTVGSHKIHLRKRRRKRKHFFPPASSLSFLHSLIFHARFLRGILRRLVRDGGRHSGGAKAAALIFGRHCQRCDRACRVTLTDLADEEAGRRMGDGSRRRRRRRSSAVPPRSSDSHLGPISQSARPDQPLAALKGRPLVFCFNRFKLPVILLASCLL